MIFKQTFLTGLLLALFALSAFAQVPDPRDSVIIESKVAGPGFDLGISSDTSAYLYLKVWITNKDSISSFLLPLEERSLSNGAYATLAWPRNFNGVVSRLTPTLGSTTSLSKGRCNSISPDTFVIGGESDTMNLSTIEPPNSIRKSFWEIKFDTVLFSFGGEFTLDSVLIPPDTGVGFLNLQKLQIPVNFIKSTIIVCNVCGDTFPTSVESFDSRSLPKEYHLSQNYPNPFNANTQIVFALPKGGHTTLEIFNLLGQKVNTLVNEYLSAGTKIVNWDGRDDKGEPVPSGVYFYQLRLGEFKETKKMLVLK